MKKYLGYLVIGLLSASFTILGMQFISKNTDSNIITTTHDSNDEGNFSFVDYRGSVAYNVPNFVEASQKTVNAVVSVINFSNQTQRRALDPFEFFFGFPQQKPESQPDRPSGQGSVVIISEDGYIVTNNHVIKGANKIEIVLNNQKSYTADLIGTIRIQILLY